MEKRRSKKRGRTHRGGKLKQFVGGLVSLFLLHLVLYRVLIVSYPHPANRCIRLLLSRTDVRAEAAAVWLFFLFF